MSTPLKRLLAASLILGPTAGFLAGRLTAPDTGGSPVLRELARQRALLEEHLARTEAPPPEVRCAVASPTGGTVDADWLRAQLTQVLREELALHTGAPDAGPRPPPSGGPAQGRLFLRALYLPTPWRPWDPLLRALIGLRSRARRRRGEKTFEQVYWERSGT